MEALNELVVAGQRLLLVELGGGSATHLAKTSSEDSRKEAIPSHWFEDLHVEHEVQQQLLSRQWASKTLCGRDWSFMAAGELGPLHQYQEVQLSPTCRRCLSILDKVFPPPKADGRIDLIVSLVLDSLKAEGVARIVGVPGDQATLLRKSIRSAIKKELGFRANTYQHDGGIEVICEEAYEPHRERRDRALVAGLSLDGESTQKLDPTSWTIRWSAWASD